jgi:hypothetical protein
MAIRSFFVCAFALALAACQAPIRLPRDFLELQDGEGWQYVTGDDARVWVREFEDPQEASLAFWASAVEHDFTQRGYDVVGKSDVHNADGMRGVLFECGANVRGERVGYLAALWVHTGWIQIVEFAARQGAYAERVEAVREALGTVR